MLPLFLERPRCKTRPTIYLSIATRRRVAFHVLLERPPAAASLFHRIQLRHSRQVAILLPCSFISLKLRLWWWGKLSVASKRIAIHFGGGKLEISFSAHRWHCLVHLTLWRIRLRSIHHRNPQDAEAVIKVIWIFFLKNLRTDFVGIKWK